MSQTRSYTASQVNTGLDKLVFEPILVNLDNPRSANNLLRPILNSSRWIEHYLPSHSLADKALKFKLIITYTILYLTLEYRIISVMLAKDPCIADPKLNYQRFPAFKVQLASQQVKFTPVSIKKYIWYRKVLWGLGTMGGILM